MFVRNESILNVGTPEVYNMDYNLKRDGWLNNFVDAMNQSMRDDRLSRWERPWFLLHVFHCPHGQGRHYHGLAMWRWYVLHLFVLLFYFFLVRSFLFVSFSVDSRVLTFVHLVLLGGSFSACCSIQQHIVALESDIDIYKSLLLSMCEHDLEHTSQRPVPQRGSVFAPPPRKMPKRNFIVCVSYWLWTCFFHFYFYGSKLLALSNVILFSSFMFKVQNVSPIRVTASLLRTCFQCLPWHSGSLAMLLGLPIFWRKHHPQSFQQTSRGFSRHGGRGGQG